MFFQSAYEKAKAYFRQLRNVCFSPRRTLLSKSMYVLRHILAIPLLLVIFLVKPWKPIRFSNFKSMSIGHLAYEIELYCREKEAGYREQNTLDLFHIYLPPANSQLADMWKRRVFIHPMVRNLRDLVEIPLIPNHRDHLIPRRQHQTFDIFDLLKNGPTKLSFSEKEITKGKNILSEMGMTPDEKFICFHVRDSAYAPGKEPGRDPRFDDYFQNRAALRNSDAERSVPAILEMLDRGYYVIRMGKNVKEELDVEHPNYIKYATSTFRSDFMDIFLLSRCYFLAGGTSGLNAVATIFNRPLALQNLIPIQHIGFQYPNLMFLPKMLWSTDEDRYVTFEEMIQTNMGLMKKREQFKKIGVKPIQNSPEEIRDLLVEMDERLKGTWESKNRDEVFQDRFRSHFPVVNEYLLGEYDENGFPKRKIDEAIKALPEDKEAQRAYVKENFEEYWDRIIYPAFRGRIGAKFLRKHKNLL